MIDRSKMQELRTTIDQALVKVGNEVGLTLKLGNGTWDVSGLTAKFTLNISEPGTSPEQETLRKAYPEYVGKVLKTPNGTFTIVGLKPRGTKFIVEKKENGKHYLMNIRSAEFWLNSKSPCV